MKLAQPHFDKEREAKRKKNLPVILGVLALVIGLIAIGALEEGTSERQKRVTAENKVKAIKENCELVGNQTSKWYECSTDLIDK